MAYDGKILAEARRQLDTIRSGNQARAQHRREEVYRRVPEILQIDSRLAAEMSELVSLTLSGKRDAPQRIDQIRQHALDLRIRRAELMTENGIPSDWLEEIFTCPLCKDTGNVTLRTDSGVSSRVCTCLDRLYNQELTRQLSTLMRGEKDRFEDFCLDYYDDTPQPGTGGMASERSAMEMVKNICKKYAENFPQVSSNLLMQGATGLGKTLLSACIARQVADKGLSVCYESAAAALGAYETARFSRDPEETAAAQARIRRMEDCSLMILDDLGTEMNTSVNTSALYALLNTRLISGRRTIVSTNCTDAELEKRYTPAIFSRLKGEFVTLHFVGKDIRPRRMQGN